MHIQSIKSREFLWPAFFSLRISFFLSLLPPLTSDKALTLTTGLSLDRQNWGPFPYTSRGPLLLWESVWEWKRSGGVYAWYGGRSVERAKPDMTVEKQSRIQEEIEQWDKQLHRLFLFKEVFLNLVLNFSVCSSSGFLVLFTASWGESSVFINREDTSVSVAVMHTGWALMKTDALSVEAEARGDSSQPSLLCSARGALMITRWDLFI